MATKPVLLFYCQHSLGMGQLVRSFGLAEALADKFRVVFLNGGRLPEGIRVPEGINIVQLPPLGMTVDGRLVSRDEQTSLAQAREMRRWQILARFHTLKPRVIVVELFPFGRKKFADELIPLFDAARQPEAGRPLILCSLRDILVGGRKNQQQHDDWASEMVNRWFDGVLVHADPEFSKIEETFQPRVPMRVPVYPTGFVLPRRDAKAPAKPRRRLVVSAGGGIAGAALFDAALAAQPVLWAEDRLPMTLVAGPFLPDTDWRRLRRKARGRDGLELCRSVPDLGVELHDAVASVSQCGYNTAMDVVYSGVPALAVPFVEGQGDEQMNRARRLEKLGLMRVRHPAGLDGPAFVHEVRALLTLEPSATALDLDGARNTARIVAKLASERFDRKSVKRSGEETAEKRR